MISSMNPLYSSADEDVKTLDDLDSVALKESIERLCGKMTSTTDGLSSVDVKTEKTDKQPRRNKIAAELKIRLSWLFLRMKVLRKKLKGDC